MFSGTMVSENTNLLNFDNNEFKTREVCNGVQQSSNKYAPSVYSGYGPGQQRFEET